MPPRKRLGQLLTELGVVDEHQLQSALGHQKQWGGKLGTILVQKGFCKEPQIVAALSKHLGLPMVMLATTKIDPRAVKYVSKQVAEKLQVFPYEVSGTGRSEVVTIAMSDPTDLAAVDQLAFHTGKRIRPMLAAESEIISAIVQHYGGGEEKKVAPDQVAPPAPAPAVPGPAPHVVDAHPNAAPSSPPAPQQQSPAQQRPSPAQQQPPEPVVPLDLPESEDGGDGPMFGLEPIAAHTQVEAIEGAQEIEGEGAAADPMEGLEPAGIRHEGADQAWGTAAEQVPAGVESGWGAVKPEQPGTAPVPAEPDAAWGADPASEPAPWTDPLEPAAWPEAENGAAGWAEPQSEGETELATEAPDSTQAQAADAPDEWAAASEDPLAAESSAGSSGSVATPAESPTEDSVAAEISAAVSAVAEHAAAGSLAAETLPADDAAADSAPLEATAGNWEEQAPEESNAAIPEPGWSETPPSAAGDWGDAPAHGIAEQEGASVESEAGGESPEEEDFEIEHEPDDAPDPVADDYAPAPIEAFSGPEGVPAPADFVEASAAPAETAEESSAGIPPPAESFAEGSLEQSAEGGSADSSLEGWTAPSEAPESGWTPSGQLSPADEGTLASVGLDPTDGIAALRALAALLRVLQRRQILDPDELAAELRESRAQEPQMPSADDYAAAGGQAPPHPQDLEGSSEAQGGPSDT